MLPYGGGTELYMTGQVGNSRLIQRMNRLKVLNYIRRNPDAARPKIARDTGLSLPSVTNNVTYLISTGLVCENGAEQAERVGRKSMRLRFCADAYGLVCVFLGVDSIDIAYTDLEGRIITRICANAAAMTPQRMVELVREKVAGLVAEFGREKILAIGVAISGLVLDGSRFVLSASLKWKEFDIKSLLERETELPVFVENMSFVKAVHYFFDVNHTGSDNMLFIDLDGGVGACQYYGGETLAQTKRVGVISTNLGRVKLLNDLSREICAGLPDYDEIKAKIDKCAAAPTYPPAMSVFAYALISGAFAFFFGGGVRECIAATAAGILVRFVMLLLDRLGAAQVIETAAASSVAASATYLAAQFMPLATDTVLISVLMNLVPGVALVNSIRDFAATDFMSGSVRIVEALFCTAAA